MKKVIGIDCGYGYIKVVSRSKNGEVRQQIIESIVGTFDPGVLVDGLKNEIETVTVGKDKFIIGRGALKHSVRILNGRDKGWIGSQAYRALLTYALAMAECNSVDLTIVTGLPVAYFNSDKAELEVIVREIAQRCCLNLTIKILPQPVGSLFSLLLDERGGVKDEALLNGKTGVLDVGYYTTDLITLDELELIERQMGSSENGVSSALEAISKDIQDAHGARLDLYAVEQSIKAGKIKLFGQSVDISAFVSKRLSELADEIGARVKTLWKNAADLDRIVLTGGGSVLLNDRLNLYRHAQLVEDAQTANARGYFAFGERIANESNSR